MPPRTTTKDIVLLETLIEGSLDVTAPPLSPFLGLVTNDPVANGTWHTWRPVPIATWFVKFFNGFSIENSRHGGCGVVRCGCVWWTAQEGEVYQKRGCKDARDDTKSQNGSENV
jgi:hypothetical protein